MQPTRPASDGGCFDGLKRPAGAAQMAAFSLRALKKTQKMKENIPISSDNNPLNLTSVDDNKEFQEISLVFLIYS
jgi:hypothetical protein